MTEEKWSEELTPEQTKLMEILSGFIADVTSLMEFMTRDMHPRKAYLCKLGYLETLGKSLKLDETFTLTDCNSPSDSLQHFQNENEEQNASLQ